MDQPAAEMYILSKLRYGLPKERTYHNFSHTLDVYRSCVAIAMSENIDGEDLDLLRTAALYHDSGFMIGHHEHEKAGCDLAREALPQFGYTEEMIERVCSMVMATKLPPKPTDHFGEILCDADLDYLGRSDFFRIGTTLFWEFLHDGIVNNEREWNELQERFLGTHTYFTAVSQKVREPVKQQHLQRIRAWLADNDGPGVATPFVPLWW
ncbi:MAG: HD domain-containing protein [Flavobacteriales bacterium]|nr:HD domain-containing protein [Flavobacteriales bacterium]